MDNQKNMPVNYSIYNVYTASHDEQEAVKNFIQRFGAPPEKIMRFNDLLWVGPVPEVQPQISPTFLAAHKPGTG